MSSLFIIEYSIHDVPKSFVIRAENMSCADAWHWASCDAGIGIIPRSSRDKSKRVSKPLAQRYGLSSVTWRPSGSLPLTAPAHESLQRSSIAE